MMTAVDAGIGTVVGKIGGAELQRLVAKFSGMRCG